MQIKLITLRTSAQNKAVVELPFFIVDSASKMTFARHNIEKRRLIELVRLNPILWDCRLPHYKRSDKKKAVKWNELGRIFNVNGERVQRTFTSLREIFRRELNHEKLLGSRFKSKWEYYEAMAFLREVIRERKSRERSKSTSAQAAQQQQQQQQNNINNNNHNNSNTGIDEYQYFAPNDPNNPNNQPPPNAPQPSLQTTVSVTQSLPMATTQQPQQQQQQQQQSHQTQHQQLQTLQLQPDVILSLNTSTLSALQKLSTNGFTPREPSPHALSTTHSGSSSPSIYIKEEPDSQDDTISLSSTQNDKLSNSPKAPSSAKAARSALSRQRIVGNRYNVGSSGRTRSLHSNSRCLIIDEDLPEADADADDDPDADILEQTVEEGRLSTVSTIAMPKHRPSAREILYTKFGDFLAARLNTLHETVANELMNKILLLIAEK